MPKHGFLTPKAIGNRIKAKGLSKLRWYCEMCVKQCRDENGFKCHQTSEGHLRQMRIFAENPEAVMKEVSGMNGQEREQFVGLKRAGETALITIVIIVAYVLLR